jgi:AmmeMemoRadiSam system protein B
MTSTTAREPAVAGIFYPSHPARLRMQVEDFIENAQPPRPPSRPRAIIAPHAGYSYSGAIAGSAYQCLRPSAQSIERVVLIGPSHHVAFSGLALSHFSRFRTPLGEVFVDRAACERIQSLPQVHSLDAAHESEHCLEVQLPFLQIALPHFTIVPLVVGSTSADDVSEALELLWDQNTLIVVSSDLSHYREYTSACSMDARTSSKIEHLDYAHLHAEDACGALAIAGLLKQASQRHLSATTLDLRNSGDTAGNRHRVVGYGAWCFHAAAES